MPSALLLRLHQLTIRIAIAFSNPSLELADGPTTIHNERCAGCEGSVVARKEERHLRDFLGFADAAERRDATDGALRHRAAALYPRYHRRIDCAGTNRVNANVIAAVFERGDFGYRDYACLRRTICRRVAQADQSRDRRRIDDRTAAVFDHVGQGVFHSEP